MTQEFLDFCYLLHLTPDEDLYEAYLEAKGLMEVVYE